LRRYIMALGRTREALAECEMVLDINPGNIRALSRAGNCCIKLGRAVQVDPMKPMSKAPGT
jgi:hypothetical protein